MRSKRAEVLACVAILTVCGACAHVFWRTEATPLSVGSDANGAPDGREVHSPLKVHLADGSTVVFREGAYITRKQITGAGDHYPLLAGHHVQRDTVPVDSVVALEVFEGKVLGAPTLVVSGAATAVATVAFLGLMKAIFGSCPTIYADTGTGPVIEAEGFSYAIAPLFEHRDVDRLRVRPAADGIIRLELRNEALETHYLNHIELAAVRHPAGSLVLPDHASRFLSVRDIRALDVATDRAGRDVRALLQASDGHLYESARSTVRAARVGDLTDWIDIEAGSLPPGDSVAVVLRLRNSLLNTVLLYDGMLGAPDALDWLGSGLQHIATAVDLSRWYTRTMGMHASVTDGHGTNAAASSTVRLNDVGPIAFRDVAIVLPRPATTSGRVRVRLRFMADNWRIDYAAIAAAIGRPTVTTIPLARVVVPTPAHGGPPFLDTAAVTAVSDADNRYLETHPGQRMTLEFAPPSTRESAAPATTTYLMVWQGWYREWIRGDWIANPRRSAPFMPGDSSALAALHRWREQRTDLEKAFYSSRIPVR